MRSEEPAVTMEETGGPDAAAGRLGAPYSEAWGYFHLAPAFSSDPICLLLCLCSPSYSLRDEKRTCSTGSIAN